MDQVCGYCGQASSEPLNRYGTHDYCMYERDSEEADDGQAVANLQG